MATYVLDGKASATLPRRPLAVQLATATPTTGVRLAARTADGASTRVIQQSPGLLILPRVDVETTIVAVPDAGRSNFDQAPSCMSRSVPTAGTTRAPTSHS